jgi:diaminopimelate epimerase
MQGAGNDFVVVEADTLELDWPRLAVSMCDRHFGIGADGLLLIAPSPAADLRMKIFNADGSEAATCGNGIRCIVKYLVDSGRYQGTDGQVTIETKSGISKAWFYQSGGSINRIKAGMGKPALGRFGFKEMLEPGELLDINKISNQYAVNGSRIDLDLVLIGNRHAVHFIETPVAEFPLAQFGPLVVNGFMGDTNFDVARVLKDDCIEARVWENGVGETLACGSGACAIGVAAHLRRYTKEKVNIQLPGGTLEIDWEKKGEVFLTGPAEKVFDGEWLIADSERKNKVTHNREKNEVLA